ncbi:hypothetical protein Nepgr_002847 [Nepenthes gracilis]|uniref:Uncharacterized protein n=1 Tax=Nepenthes gracilis TaxID=150966 RepID=A0AAD3RYH5_NEPGR|nr:hypothetical protein Nepgr_002847 [Nepenthes gracilis]
MYGDPPKPNLLEWLPKRLVSNADAEETYQPCCSCKTNDCVVMFFSFLNRGRSHSSLRSPLSPLPPLDSMKSTGIPLTLPKKAINKVEATGGKHFDLDEQDKQKRSYTFGYGPSKVQGSWGPHPHYVDKIAATAFYAF